MIAPEFAILVWIPVSALLIGLVSPVRAIFLAYLVGWALLPMEKIQIQGFWDVDKHITISAGVILGIVVFRPDLLRRLREIRPVAADGFIALFAVGACLTSISNHLGIYDGLSGFAQMLLVYGTPYLAGRICLRGMEDLQEASRVVVVVAALCAVAALWEWRMSPHLHRSLYGTFPHEFNQHIRWGFYRPLICFPHALALGTFFAWASLVALWLYRTGAMPHVLGIPSWCWVIGPIVGLLLSMSFGPWAVFLAGAGLMAAWEYTRWQAVALIPVVFAGAWMVMRYVNVTDGGWLVKPVAQLSEMRARSLESRIHCETLLLDRARHRVLLGWGTWGRNRVTDEKGNDLVVTDGWWIILLGSGGLVALISFFGWWCWPVIMAVRLPAVAHPLAMIFLTSIGLLALTFLFNAFLSPVLVILHGGMVTLLRQEREVYAAGARRAAPAYARWASGGSYS